MTREERYPFELRYTGSPFGWFEDGSYEYDVWSRHKTYEAADRKGQYEEQFTHGSNLKIVDTRPVEGDPYIGRDGQLYKDVGIPFEHRKE